MAQKKKRDDDKERKLKKPEPEEEELEEEKAALEDEPTDEDEPALLDEPAEEELAVDDDEAAEKDSAFVEEPEEEEAAFDEEAAEEEAAFDEEPADDDATAAADLDTDAVPAGRSEDEEEEEIELPPRPRTPIFTLVLLILNLLAAPPFLVLLVMDYAAREQWSRATFMNRLYPVGLPFSDEEDTAPVAFYTRPRLRITGDELKKVYASPSHPKAPGTPGITEPFQPADTTDEPIDYRIRPSQIDDRVKDELFKGLGDPVATLDQEVERLRREVPQKIEEAATKFVADNAAKKVAALQNVLLPLAWSTTQVDALQARIDAMKGKDAELDKLLKEAAERRMLTDILAPMNIYRPGDVTKFPIEKICELDTYSLDELMELMKERIELKGDDVTKRHNLAFLMVCLGRVKVPESNELVFPKALQRAQVVCGLYEFAQAAANYPRTLRVLQKRVLDAIAADRAGYVVAAGPTRTETGFVDQLATEIQRLVKVKADIEFTAKRVKTFEARRDEYQKQYEERLMLLTEVTRKLVQARGETAKLRADLQMLQDELFEAQVYLSSAAARNERLEQQIGASEKLLLPKKGGKTQ